MTDFPWDLSPHTRFCYLSLAYIHREPCLKNGSSSYFSRLIFRLFFFWYVHYCKCNEANYLCHPSSAATTRHRQNGKPQGVGRRERLCGALTLFSHFLCFEQTILLDCSSALLEREEQKLECHFDFHTIKRASKYVFLVTWSFPNNPKCQSTSRLFRC